MRWVTWIVVAALAAVAVCGCDPAQTRVWTVRASVVETGLINNSEFMDQAQRLSADQVEALGTARVLVYEKYAEQLKAALEGLKGD